MLAILRRTTVACSLLLASAALADGPAYPEAGLPELARLLDEAREKSPALVSQALAQQEATARLDAARSGYYPRVDINANFGYRKSMYQESGIADEDSFGANFNAVIRRPLYHWGAIEARIRQARLDFINEDLERVHLLRGIKRSLRADYLALIVHRAELNNLALRRQAAEDALARTASDRAAGTIGEAEAEEARLSVEQSLIDIEAIEAEQARILAAYKRDLGWDTPLALDQAPASPDLPALLAWVERTRATGLDSWLSDQGEVQRRQNLLEREKAELIRIAAGQRPLFNFAASAGQGQSNTAGQNNVNTFSYFVGVDVSWNIFDGFETSAKRREANFRLRRIERELAAYQDELRAQSFDLLRQIAFRARQLQLDERRAALSATTLATQEREAGEGRVSAAALRERRLASGESALNALRSRVTLLLALNDYLDLTLPAAVELGAPYSEN